ncbi:histidine phosphatase family protein [Colwellia sp. 1_MG-2023]|uniref:histidine phosphatase family protein n=1 Tax=Colwellia sp. 1_MG-2023 TaxID=3062649 RepID=UPI0026E41521|nr:histidine phosphatase family protein [Colwellia sp. 1_MG-2023]MDO6447203.1 histidine phosphatase family protein [Colwellia sp. 1_MG-2023]
MANIYLLRHGKVSGEAALYGKTDVEVLPEINLQIAKQFAALNLPIDAVITSPLIRCASLAQLIGTTLQRPVSAMAQLKEMDFGLYDGIAFDQLHQDKGIWQQLERFWQNPVQHPLPNAELLTGFSYRVINAWQAIIADVIKPTVAGEQSTDNILLVCHGGVIRMILAHLLNIDFRNPLWYTNLSIANASLTAIDINQQQPRVKQIAKPLLKVNSELSPATNDSVSRRDFPYNLLEQSHTDYLRELN